MLLKTALRVAMSTLSKSKLNLSSVAAPTASYQLKTDIKIFHKIFQRINLQIKTSDT